LARAILFPILLGILFTISKLGLGTRFCALLFNEKQNKQAIRNAVDVFI
jgi:hypothetical protein